MNDVRVTLATLVDPLDTDPVYLQRERTKGLLRWLITVPSAAVREKARVLEYSYSVEFDRSFQLGTWAGGSQQYDDYRLLERSMAAPSAEMEAPVAPSEPTAPPP